jgi:predicted O-methyltransferase YrrM
MVDSIADRAVWRTKNASLAQQVTSETLTWLMRSEDAKQFTYPAAYVELLQRWIEESTVEVKTVKPRSPGDDVAGRRFSVLLQELAFRLPMAPVNIAREAGLYADGLMSRQETVTGDWNSDVGLHFYNSSSLGRKGRILHAIVRSSRASKYLELGTAYGMSSLFVARTMEMRTPMFLVTTVEAIEQQHLIAMSMLRDRFGKSVDGRLGWSKECLSQLARESRSFDLLFHDAGHSYDDYVDDFALAEPMMAPGAICVIDDIRWDDSRHAGGARCYEGWMAMVSHPRVRAAAELDGSVGILLLT